MIGVILWKKHREFRPPNQCRESLWLCNLVSLAAECERRVTLALTNSEKTFLSWNGSATAVQLAFRFRCVSATGRVGAVLGEDGVVESFAAEVGDVLHEGHNQRMWVVLA